MKKITAFIFLIFFVYGCGHLPANDHERIFSSENILIDVRTPLEYHQGHIAKSVNIPFDKIKEEIKYFAPDKEQTVVVYCLSGARADIAAKELKGLGYKNIINAGKFKELKEMEEKEN